MPSICRLLFVGFEHYIPPKLVQKLVKTILQFTQIFCALHVDILLGSGLTLKMPFGWVGFEPLTQGMMMKEGYHTGGRGRYTDTLRRRID